MAKNFFERAQKAIIKAPYIDIQLSSSLLAKDSVESLYWQRLKSIGLVTGPGGLLATRPALATNPRRDKPIEDYSTLHRGPRQGFVTEGPRQRYVTEWGGPRQTPISRHSQYLPLTRSFDPG